LCFNDPFWHGGKSQKIVMSPATAAVASKAKMGRAPANMLTSPLVAIIDFHCSIAIAYHPPQTPTPQLLSLTTIPWEINTSKPLLNLSSRILHQA
jgi:hypothetical protein